MARCLRGSTFRLCVYVVFMLFHIVVSEILLGSKLSVVENNLWVSSNGDFAFGYFNHPDIPNQFRIGIRISSKLVPISKQPVVWIAGPEISVSNQSYFELTKNGELVLYDSLNGLSVWSSETSQLSVSSAFLRYDGNLILLNKKKNVVWQSFDSPSDTLLPGQKLNADKTLRANSQTSLTSYYSLRFDTFGELQLRWESNITYWTSKTSKNSSVNAILTPDGAFQLWDQKSNPVWSVYGEDHDDNLKFRFLRLDADGNLRIYSWAENSNSWRVVWQAVENQCKVFATCGERGICRFNLSGFSECKCPYGSDSKCLVPYKYEECESDSNLIVYRHTSLYGIYPVNDSISQANLHQCKALCEADPNCMAATFMNNEEPQCKIMTTRYITGYTDPSLSSISFVKQCSNPTAVDPRALIHSPQSSHNQSNKLSALCFIAGIFLVFVIIQVGTCFFVYKRRNLLRKKSALAFRNFKGLITLSFEEICEVTENFNTQNGPVTFKGTLHNNQPVTVKKLEPSMDDRKFRTLAMKIGNIHHKNLVKLQAYCSESDYRYLVYECAKHGSIQKHLEDSKLSTRLTWQKRVEICLTVARAVCYLHTECRQFISHGNLNSENVLLDENFETKVIEYGLEDNISAEKDVEDFGKLILTLLSGCHYQFADDVSVWAYGEWFKGRGESMLDKRIEGEVDCAELERFLRIAFWCLQPNVHMRPPMGEVVKVLDGTLSVDPPPPPFAS
ncbi:hypothetical protein ACFE04_030452 [Oxalis oulophora]